MIKCTKCNEVYRNQYKLSIYKKEGLFYVGCGWCESGTDLIEIPKDSHKIEPVEIVNGVIYVRESTDLHIKFIRNKFDDAGTLKNTLNNTTCKRNSLPE